MNYSKDSNTKKQRTKKSSKKKVKNRIGLVIMRIIFIVIIISGFAVVGAGMGAYLGIIGSAPDISLLQVTPNSFTSIIYVNESGQELDRLHGAENREYIKISDIPQNMKDAIVAIEDERFYTHNGIDFKGMVRALASNVEALISGEKGLQGASTLTQQLIKLNLFQEEINGKKTIQRKLQEQYMAIQLEKQLTTQLGSTNKAKDQILELYLNTINLSNNAYGIQAASKRYFGKDATQLTLAECAMMASIPQNPSLFDPINKPDKNQERQQKVLKNMLDQGYITQDEYTQAKTDDIYNKIQTAEAEKPENTSTHSYYVDQLITELIKDLQEKKGLSKNQATNLIYNGGLQIYSCIDTNIQKIVDDAYKNPDLFPPSSALEVIYKLSVENKVTKEQTHYNKSAYVDSKEEADAFVEKTKKELLTSDVNFVLDNTQLAVQPQSAFIVTDYHNGQVKALIGGRGEKTANRTYNRATQAVRQPGSTFKVLAAYAPALDTGIVTPATVFNDAPYTLGKWSPSNWYNTGFRGLVTVRTAIKDSMNIIAAKTIAAVGIPTSWDYLLNFGFTTLVDSKVINGKTYTDKNATISLGGLTDGVNLLELNSAYGTIANGGKYQEPIFYTKVLDHDGNILLDNTTEPKRVLKETTAFLLTDMMKDVITSGTGKLARFKKVKMPISGKTGTTTDDKDLVFAGYTPYYAASVWLGHDKPKTLKYDKSYHLLLWSNIMEQIHANLEYKDFEKPDGIVSAKVCNVSGKLAVSGLCDKDPRGSRVITEYFANGTVPTESCDGHILVKIDKRTGLLANENTPTEFVEEVVRLVRPADADPANASTDAQYYAPSEFTDAPDGATEDESQSTDSTTETLPNEEIVPPIIDPNQSNPATQTPTQQPTDATEIPSNPSKIEVPLTIDDFRSPY